LASSTSSCSRLRLKNARFNPENIADWETQNRIPNQTTASEATVF
jgi:hypothetical protein